MAWNRLASEESLEKTIKALNENGISAFVVNTGAEAKAKALSIIPEGAEVLTVTSTTANTIGLAQELNESGNYVSIRDKFAHMDRNTQKKEMRALGSAPDWVVGSAHAVTEDGKVIIVSQSGSQLPADVYGAEHVLWIVGTHKIVKNVDEGFKRIYEYVFALEDERAKKAYNGHGTSVNKMLIINKESVANRITIIFVKEVLGF